MFCTSWLRDVLRATTACTFLTSQFLNVVRTCDVLYILTSGCASGHNGVQLFISHLAKWLRTRRFSEPTFWPSGATNHRKNTMNRDFPTISRSCVFFLLLSVPWSSYFFSAPLWFFPPLLFHLSILSEVSLLNFFRQIYITQAHSHITYIMYINFNQFIYITCIIYINFISSTGAQRLHTSYNCLGYHSRTSSYTGIVTQDFVHRSSCTEVLAQEFVHKSCFTRVLTQELHRNGYTKIVLRNFYTKVVAQELLHRNYRAGGVTQELAHKNWILGGFLVAWIPTKLVLLKFL